MKKIVISGLLAGVAIFAVSMASTFLIGSILPDISKQYQNTNLFRPWADPLMNLYFAYPLVLGLALAFFWDKTKQAFQGKGLNRAVNFGWWITLISTVPGMWITYSSFQISLEMVVAWAVVGFMEVVTAAWVLDKVNG